MRVAATTQIACPRETVFDTLADLRNDTRWNSHVSRAEPLTPIGEGTELASDFDFRPSGALKVLFPLLAPVIRRDVPEQYASFKALCES